MLQAALDCIITIDHRGRVVEFNPAAERTFGYRREDVIGREMAVLIVPPALRDQHRHGLARCLQTGTGPVLDKRIEMPAIRADGTEFPVELTITRVPGDAAPLFTGYLRDITDRKRAERRRATELAVSHVLVQADSVEEGMRGILQAVCESLAWDLGAIWTVDEREQVLRCTNVWHSPRMAAHEFETITRERTFSPGVGLPGRVWASGQPAWIPDVVHDTNFPRAGIAAKEGLHAAFGFPVALRRQIIGVVEFFSRRIEQPDDDLLQMMAIIGGHIGQFLDRKQAETALRDADRRKDEFLATLAHELRNPLAPISNALAIMRHAAGQPHVAEQARETIERQLTSLVRLVDDLLDVSRITLNKIELRRAPVALSAVVQIAIETSLPLIEQARHDLIVTLPAQPVWLDVDAVRIAQAISNLINNAVKYTPPGGRIWLDGSQQDGEAVVVVRDSGVGIPADMLGKVFDIFMQVDPSREHSHGGLGIGLTVVKHLVEMHDGSVSVSSAGLDRGTEFTVRLPVAAETAAAIGSATDDALPAGEGRRILIVDDNADSADTLALLLGMRGHEVRTARDGATALEIAASYLPQVAMLDIGLPGMSGHDVGRLMRSLPELEDVMLIAVTGWGQEEDLRRSRAAGFDHHLIKPVDMGVLEQLLAQRRRA